MKHVIVEIPEYIRRVKLSEARNAKYYEFGKKHPKAKRFLNKDKYDWKDFNGRRFLICLETGEKVISNPRAAGTPRILTINGQKIYNGEVSKHIRNKVLSEIKESFAPYVNTLDVINEFPLRIEMEIHDVIRESSGDSLWDIDNRAWPYIKGFQDCLTGNRDKKGKYRNKQVVPDDNILYITQPPAPKFIPVDNEEDRKLVFKIVKEEDERILKHKGYIQELKKLKHGK